MSRLFVVLALVTAPVFADDYYSQISEKLCPGGREMRNEFVCTKTKGAFEASRAGKGRKLNRLPIDTLDPIFDLGLMPDADTDVIYTYFNNLTNDEGRVVGYLQIIGLNNSEMEERIQANVRYTKSGKMASVTVTEK